MTLGEGMVWFAENLSGFFIFAVEDTVDLETMHAILKTHSRRVQRLSSDT